MARKELHGCKRALDACLDKARFAVPLVPKRRGIPKPIDQPQPGAKDQKKQAEDKHPFRPLIETA